MIPAIDLLDLPDPPTCCTDTFAFAEALLAWIWTGTIEDPGIVDCVGSDGPCGPMDLAVTWGPPIITVGASVLAVYLATPAFSIRLPRGAGNSPAVQMVPVTDVVYGIEMWEACYPVPADDGNGPSYAVFHEANRHAYAHGTALWRRLLDGYMRNFGQIAVGCSVQRLGPLSLVSPGEPGMSVGWRTQLQVTW